ITPVPEPRGAAAAAEERFAQERGLRVAPGVVVEVEPDVVRGHRRDVAPGDHLAAGQGPLGGIQVRVNRIAGVAGRNRGWCLGGQPRERTGEERGNQDRAAEGRAHVCRCYTTGKRGYPRYNHRFRGGLTVVAIIIFARGYVSCRFGYCTWASAPSGR